MVLLGCYNDPHIYQPSNLPSIPSSSKLCHGFKEWASQVQIKIREPAVVIMIMDRRVAFVSNNHSPSRLAPITLQYDWDNWSQTDIWYQVLFGYNGICQVSIRYKISGTSQLDGRSTRDGHLSKKEDFILDTLLESVNCTPKMLGYHLIVYTFMDHISSCLWTIFKSMFLASSLSKERSHEARSTNSAHPAGV